MDKTFTVPRHLVAGAIAALLVGACAETPTAARAPRAPSFSEAGDAAGNIVSNAHSDSMFIANSRKYADTGRKPVNGRAGSATLGMLALLSKDGRGDVELLAGEWDGWTRGRKMRDDPPGDAYLTRAQIKAFDPSGKLEYTRNVALPDTEATTLAVGGLIRGGRVQVQANIKGADVARTGVVTVEGPVLLRPDLTVAAIRQPPRAALNSAVPIIAVIRELNGNLGAWADCVLFVNGVETDRAYGVWVDAGGTVTCQMSHMFRTLGNSSIEVRVERVAPRDYDPANNVAASTMSVIRIPSAFYYDASFEDRFFASSSTWESSILLNDGSSGSEYSSTDSNSGRLQQANLYAVMPRAVSFPLVELFARQATRDEQAHAVLFRGIPADWTFDDGYVRQSCLSRGYDSPATGRGWLHVCSYQGLAPNGPPDGWTTVQYDRFAGDVTYASRGHSHYWNRDLGIDDVYSFNYAGRDLVGRFVSYGLEYGFFVRVIDGANVYTVNPLIGLLPFEDNFNMPRTCWSMNDGWASIRSCSESASSAHGVRGWVSGEPTF